MGHAVASVSAPARRELSGHERSKITKTHGMDGALAPERTRVAHSTARETSPHACEERATGTRRDGESDAEAVAVAVPVAVAAKRELRGQALHIGAVLAGDVRSRSSASAATGRANVLIEKACTQRLDLE
jgi:hypothetical protein